MRRQFALSHLERLRLEEINAVKRWFAPGMAVLELGGGSGFQASVIASWGCHVRAIDISAANAETSCYPVEMYGGLSVPFADAAFDLVFSSNVLEHIPHLAQTLSETKRVLKPTGIEIHIVPTNHWRLWTSAARILFLIGRGGRGNFVKHNGQGAAAKLGDGSSGTQSRSLASLLMGAPHGENATAFSELALFSRTHWTQVFQEHGFQVITVTTNQLFYTGYCLFPNLLLKHRRVLSSILGAACHVFVLKPCP